jgi:SNF2 family DNA or RNA helicase
MQFIKRVARQGQKEKSVFIHFLLFKGSIDEYILKTLNGKEMTQQSLLDFINDN